MFPKEHGAWNALLVSLALGWSLLGDFDPMALALTLLWLSGFILRAPLSTFLQYQRADPSKARKAATWAFALTLLLLGSLASLWKDAPSLVLGILGVTAAPSLILLVLFLQRRTLHFLFAEILGFLTLCLCAPALYLLGPASLGMQAGLLYLFVGGYFLLGLLYVRIRFEWMKRSKPEERLKVGERRSFQRGLLDVRGILVLGLTWLGAVLFFPGSTPWQAAAPLYALARMAVGALWGNRFLPPMTLGVREMTHSFVFLALVLGTWD